ncbi:hypothetical protein SAMN03159341_10346 [Paenibacillus sp. 1_12]|uniref:hypothetical protein n=1 Tax=Paenibacillus sp. 1_12 TaxID=1566278 RepID=UPI0008E34D7C|nr:hypothetical protein [Paenibacillus sp. 1_12]SFL06776.1 hypothetical protein SAMN03159341_10346 [Paenibacillus sp. 1_12]
MASALIMETAADGTSVQKLDLPEHILDQAAEQLKDSAKAIIIIKMADTKRSVQVQLSGASIAAIASALPSADIEVELSGSSLQLKASVIDLGGIAKRLGVAVSEDRYDYGTSKRFCANGAGAACHKRAVPCGRQRR